MNWLRLCAILFGLLFLATIVLFLILSPATPDSAEPEIIIKRIEKSADLFPNLSFTNITTVGERMLVQAEFIGNPAIFKQEADWHQLAQSTANQLYADVVKNRSLEVQIYQGNILRAVAVAGL